MKVLPRRRKAVTDEPIRSDLPYQCVRRNLILHRDGGLWAAYVLGPQPYPFATLGDQVGIVQSAQQRWAELAGHRVQMRVTSHPFPFVQWAQALDLAHPPGRRLPDSPDADAETWAQYLAASQAAAIAYQCEKPLTYLLVRVSTRRLDPAALNHILGDHEVSADIQRIRRDLTRITDVIARPGFSGKPASARALAWLIHASHAISVPAPDVAVGEDDLTDQDMQTFTAPVRQHSEAYDPYVTVRAVRGGATHTRYVTVLSMGRNQPRDEAGEVPWLAFPRSLDYPVEVTATFDVLRGDELAGTAEARRRLLEDNVEHYHDHGEKPPAELTAALEEAHRIENEVSSGTPEESCRLIGPVRVALADINPESLAQRVSDFISQMRRNQRIDWVESFGQQALIREFLPTGSPDLAGLRRRIPAIFMATAVPNSATSAGTPRGPLLGVTCSGGREAVLFDATYGPTINKSGLTVVFGAPGKGKSTTAALIVENEVRLGGQGIVNDPSNQLHRLADAPHLRRHTRVINLGRATPGTLNPYDTVPDPRTEDYPGLQWALDNKDRILEDRELPNRDALLSVLDEYDTDVQGALAERREVAIDSLAGLVPPAMLSGPDGGSYQTAIREAAYMTPAHYGQNLWAALAALESGEFGDWGRSVARSVRSVSGQAGARLLFPRQDGQGDAPPNDAALTIVTFPGLAAPEPGVPREHWSLPQQIGALVMSSSAKYAARAMYEPGRKVIVTDEKGLIGAGITSMHGFLNRGARDSRKHRTGFVIASQNPGDYFPISDEIANLIGTAFIFGMESRDAATAALRLANLPLGYEDLILRLETGQCLLRDWTNPSPQVVQILLEHRPVMEHVLNTNPGRTDPTATFNIHEVFA